MFIAGPCAAKAGDSTAIAANTFFTSDTHFGHANIFGHVHAGRGRTERDGTTFTNASIMNEAYDSESKPWVLDFPGR